MYRLYIFEYRFSWAAAVSTVECSRSFVGQLVCKLHTSVLLFFKNMELLDFKY